MTDSSWNTLCATPALTYKLCIVTEQYTCFCVYLTNQHLPGDLCNRNALYFLGGINFSCVYFYIKFRLQKDNVALDLFQSSKYLQFLCIVCPCV